MIDFIANFWDSLSNGLYELVVWSLSGIIKALTLWGIEFKMYMISLSWDVASEILDSLSITDELESAWSSMDSDVLAIATSLRIPDAISMIMNAYVTRYVMRFLG